MLTALIRVVEKHFVRLADEEANVGVLSPEDLDLVNKLYKILDDLYFADAAAADAARRVN